MTGGPPPPPPPQPPPNTSTTLLSYWSSATMTKCLNRKKPICKKNACIEVALYLSVNGASSTGATLIKGDKNTFLCKKCVTETVPDILNVPEWVFIIIPVLWLLGKKGSAQKKILHFRLILHPTPHPLAGDIYSNV